MRRLSVGLAAILLASLAPAEKASAGLRSTCEASKPDGTGSKLCDGLVSFYSFDEASGYTRRDSISAIDFFETDSWPLGNAAGIIGNSVVFPAVGTGYTLHANTYPLLGGGGTYALWIYPTYSPNCSLSPQQVLVSKDNVYDRGTRLYLQCTSNTYYPAVSGYYIDDTAWSKISTTSVTINQWHLLVYTMVPYVGSSFTSNVCVSVDNGAFQCSAFTNVVRNSPSELALGCSYYPIESNCYVGRLDHFAIALRVWSAADVTRYWNGGSAKAFPFVN